MENICKNCKHFRQHYIKSGRRYSEIADGHCPCPRLKIRKVYAPACQQFIERETPEK